MDYLLKGYMDYLLTGYKEIIPRGIHGNISLQGYTEICPPRDIREYLPFPGVSINKILLTDRLHDVDIIVFFFSLSLPPQRTGGDLVAW